MSTSSYSGLSAPNVVRQLDGRPTIDDLEHEHEKDDEPLTGAIADVRPDALRCCYCGRPVDYARSGGYRCQTHGDLDATEVAQPSE
ncbi:hypothetical protein [Halopiger djelfimassiliensis]|uniref:hypothetical protein n=1 Tax=Halopiger djelfimassiliensis TaxID=1293047 RepID=UPI0006775AB9|nr:hypothetical protein [Halopiger djelfimassiliensis]